VKSIEYKCAIIEVNLASLSRDIIEFIKGIDKIYQEHKKYKRKENVTLISKFENHGITIVCQL